MGELESLLREGLAEAGQRASDAQIEALLSLTRLLHAWGQRINLTGHREPEAIIRRLVLDGAAVLQVLPAFASLADLGSGAGLPGLPMAILAPAVRVVLVEARLRRHHFQRAARRETGLQNVELLHGRIEELAPRPSEVVIAQAVAPPDRVLEWMLPWARAGGLLVIPGSETPPAPTGPAVVGLEEIRVARYRVPLGGPERSLWLARKGTA